MSLKCIQTVHSKHSKSHDRDVVTTLKKYNKVIQLKCGGNTFVVNLGQFYFIPKKKIKMFLRKYLRTS